MTDDLNNLVDELNAPLNPNFKCGYVAVVGKPNVGKSAIVNALVGHRVAITSPKAQTTRRRVLGIFSDADKQVLFMDTPGIHQPKRELGKFMMRQVEMALGEDGPWVDAKSIVKVMATKAPKGTVLHLRAEGEAASDAVRALVSLVERDFDEDESHARTA